MAEQEPLTLDVRGRACPIPVIELAKAMRGAGIGDVVVVLSDDPTAKVDVPVWCRMQRQRFREQRELEGGGWAFEVEKIADLG